MIKPIFQTAVAGVGIFILGEGIIRIPCLKKSDTYLPIPKAAIYVAGTLEILQDVVELAFKKVLKDRYTYTFYFCVAGPIIEELGHRLLFQELFLKQGMNFFAKQLGISYDPDRLHWKIFRIGSSALVFAAQHTWAFNCDKNINPYGAASLVYLVATGIIDGIVQEKTGNTLYPMAMHIINNSMTFYLTENLLLN